MPFNKDIRGTTPKAMTSSPVQAASSAMVTAVQKLAEPCATTEHGRTEPKQDAPNAYDKPNSDSKKPADAGRIPQPVTPVASIKPAAAAVTDKDVKLVSTL